MTEMVYLWDNTTEYSIGILSRTECVNPTQLKNFILGFSDKIPRNSLIGPQSFFSCDVNLKWLYVVLCESFIS